MAWRGEKAFGSVRQCIVMIPYESKQPASIREAIKLTLEEDPKEITALNALRYFEALIQNRISELEHGDIVRESFDIGAIEELKRLLG